MISQTPLVSVVIPAYNEEKYIINVLESLQKQTYHNFEIIVVDNNSQDKTAEIARKFGATVVSENTLGVSQARQKGAEHAHGEIIATTDSDAVVPENWLETIVQTFQRHPDVVVCGGLGKFNSGPLIARIFAKYGMYPFALLDKLTSGGWSFAGFNMAYRKEAFLKTAGYDPKLKVAEDHDISTKLKKLGKAYFIKSLVVDISGRRFEKGFFKELYKTYIITFFTRIFFGRNDTLGFEPYR